MCSCSFLHGPSRLEYYRRYKPENTKGCIPCGNTTINDCSTPSIAEVGSPRWEWEQQYGKIVTTISWYFDENGHEHKLIERKPCPLENEKSNNIRKNCSTIKYKVKK